MLTRLLADRRGSAVIEMAIIFPLLFLMTIGILEFGNLLFQWVSAEKATEAGARYAVTSTMAAVGVSDCGVDPGAATAGTPCSQIPGSDAWTITCAQGSSGCDAAAFNAIVGRMAAVFPRVTAANVVVEYSGAGLGFVGRGGPVPVVSVSLQGVAFQFAVLDALAGLPDVVLPAFRASLTGEDLSS